MVVFLSDNLLDMASKRGTMHSQITDRIKQTAWCVSYIDRSKASCVDSATMVLRVWDTVKEAVLLFENMS